jgi:sterol desaturase/sphingolipid hydroxylase (fatty acid hydroxylase superfamily)
MGTLTLVQASVCGFLIAAESIVSYSYSLGVYEKRDTLVSIVLGIFSALVIFSTTGVFLGLLLFMTKFSLFDIRPTWISWFSLLIICDISYYLLHLLSHKVRFLWASHMLHHSSHKLNYTTVFRGPIVYLSFRMIFWLPMVLVGFSPYMIIVTDTIIQLYTVFTHTTLIGRLGFLELIFNTPAHHRLHHASNPTYIDRNFGGMFIIWDRLFGTFVDEQEKPLFGLVETKDIQNPFTLVLMEWKNIFHDIKSSSTWKHKWKSVFGRPGKLIKH